MVATATTAVLTAVIAVMNFAEVQEPKWIATRGFVRAQLERMQADFQTGNSSNSYRIIGAEIAIKEGERRQVQRQIDVSILELEKNPQAPEPLRRLIGDQVRQYNDQITNLTRDIEDLRRQQSVRRPQ